MGVPGFCARELGIRTQVLTFACQALCQLSRRPSPFPPFLNRRGLSVMVETCVKALHPGVRLPRFEPRLHHFSAGSIEQALAFRSYFLPPNSGKTKALPQRVTTQGEGRRHWHRWQIMWLLEVFFFLSRHNMMPSWALCLVAMATRANC